ncbi:hypothetical protein AUJ46_01600 [Candidatus Peregrinibacteria bacterium CG1_02_54_53]|nr:MAG: hypothetical protein AUJ46_01600 [Candidatus Peregrinibacteria bacterium CG1_02_54_53]
MQQFPFSAGLELEASSLLSAPPLLGASPADETGFEASDPLDPASLVVPPPPPVALLLCSEALLFLSLVLLASAAELCPVLPAEPSLPPDGCPGSMGPTWQPVIQLAISAKQLPAPSPPVVCARR